MIGLGAVISIGLMSGTVLPLFISGSGAVLAYAMAVLMLMLLVQCMARLTTDGAATHTFSESISRYLGDKAACFTRGTYVLALVSIIGTEIVFLVSVIKQWIPILPRHLTGVTTLFLLALNIGQSTRAFAFLETALSIMKVTALVGLIAASCYVIGAGENAAMPLGANWLADILQPDASLLWVSFIVATLGFAGIEVLSLAASETAATPCVIRARMLAISGWLAGLTLAAVAAMSALTYTARLPLPVRPSLYLLNFFSQRHADTALGLLVVITVLSVVNSLLYCAARTLREAALAGDLPLRLRGAFAASPRVAPLAAFACSASIFIALTLDGQFVFKLATAVATTGALTVWLMIFLASFRLASRRETAGSLPPPLKRWKAVLGASITVAIFVSLHFFELFSSSLQWGLPAVVLVGGATLLAKRSKPE